MCARVCEGWGVLSFDATLSTLVLSTNSPLSLPSSASPSFCQWIIDNGGIAAEDSYPYVSGNGTTGVCKKPKLKVKTVRGCMRVYVCVHKVTADKATGGVWTRRLNTSGRTNGQTPSLLHTPERKGIGL